MTEDLKQACRTLSEGGVIVYPTDTVWGIGCDATNEEAVRRVYDIKRRLDARAMLVLVDSAVKVDFYVREVPAVAWDLIELSTRPLTLIYPHARHLATNLVADDGSIGIRVVAKGFAHELCRRFRKAIVSTSANVSGEPTPRRFADISTDILRAADYVCLSERDTTPADTRPSSIIKIGSGGQVEIIRE